MVDEFVAANGCTNLSDMLANIASQASSEWTDTPMARHFAVDCVVRVCMRRPDVAGNLCTAGVIPSLVTLLEVTLDPPPSRSRPSRSRAAVVLVSFAFISVLLAALGHLCVHNPKIGSAVAEAGAIPLISSLVKSGRDSTDSRWVSVHQQAEFALKAALPSFDESRRSTPRSSRISIA